MLIKVNFTGSRPIFASDISPVKPHHVTYMNKGKFSDRNRRYVLKRSQRHRPVCTCGTYLKSSYVLDRIKGASKWVEIGYFCPSCLNFYRTPPDSSIVFNEVIEPKSVEELKRNLEKLFLN